MIIYKVTNKINNKIYIGQTVLTLEDRKLSHYKEAKYKNNNNLFHNALNKYKMTNFIWETIYETDILDDLNNKEIYYIAYYNTTNKNMGYNLKLGGKNGGKNSESTKILIGQKTKERYNNPEIKNKLLEGLRKGTETIKLKSLSYFEIRKCRCGKEFKCKPHHTTKYCSKECLKLYKQNSNIQALEIANDKNKIRFETQKQNVVDKTHEWFQSNVFKLSKKYSFSTIKELLLYLGIKDKRTLKLAFDNINIRDLYYKLLKMYAEPSDE